MKTYEYSLEVFILSQIKKDYETPAIFCTENWSSFSTELQKKIMVSSPPQVVSGTITEWEGAYFYFFMKPQQTKATAGIL